MANPFIARLFNYEGPSGVLPRMKREETPCCVLSTRSLTLRRLILYGTDDPLNSDFTLPSLSPFPPSRYSLFPLYVRVILSSSDDHDNSTTTVNEQLCYLEKKYAVRRLRRNNTCVMQCFHENEGPDILASGSRRHARVSA